MTCHPAANAPPVGASLLAMVVNDNARLLVKHGARDSIVGTPPGASSLLQFPSIPDQILYDRGCAVAGSR
mgnify:CR=1 FL=1